MVNQKEALKELNKEREFEDKIASDLYNYYILLIDKISDLSEFQKSKIREKFNILANESELHRNMFSKLIEYVIENGEDNY